jgi:hypothetical protein
MNTTVIVLVLASVMLVLYLMRRRNRMGKED